MSTTFEQIASENSPGNWPWWLIRGLALLAVAISSYLAWVSWQMGPVLGCDGGTFDCDEVLGSRWSSWLGLPVSLLGGLTYVAMLVLSWPASRRPGGWAWASMLSLSCLAVGSALWFIGVQAIALDSYCKFCLAVHSCGLTILITLATTTRQTGTDDDLQAMRNLLGVADGPMETSTVSNGAAPLPHRIALVSVTTILGLAVLIGGQEMFPPKTFVLEDIVESPSMDQATQSEEPDAQDSADLVVQEPEQELERDSVEDKVDDPIEDVVSAEDQEEDEIEEPLEAEADVPFTLDETSLEAGTSAESNGTDRFYVQFGGLANRIDIRNDPSLGSLEAEHVIVEYMDYTCPGCRKMHGFLRQVEGRYGDQLLVLVRHVPLSPKCNKNVPREHRSHKNACDYANLARSVWVLAPEEFPAFHDWLLKGEKVPSLRKAKDRAMSLAGIDVLTDRSIRERVKRRVVRNCEEHQRVGKTLPLMLTELGVLRGMPDTADIWFEFLESKLKLEPIEP